MIIADRFLWLHLPKTGGTSMNSLCRQWQVPGLQIDPDDTAQKHDSVALRESRGNWRAGDRRRFITARRLADWLVSDWQHKHTFMGLTLPFEPVRSGLFYSLRLGGTWVAADWWLQYFEVDDSVTALRLEHLHDDLNRHLLPLLPPDTPQAPPPPHVNRSQAPERPEQLDAGDRERIRAVNPRWRAWEDRLYPQEP